MNLYENHFYPFFWQHGEDETTLVNYVEKIYNSGMRALCVESRPHPDFVGEKWWNDLKTIIRECKKRNMKVWILDDAYFPSGSVNNLIKNEFPHYKKLYLATRRFDVVGPFKGARIDASHLKGRIWEKSWNVHEIIGVYLIERINDKNNLGDPVNMETSLDITDSLINETIYLDIPKGNWSVFVVFSTQDGGEDATKDYLNPLVKEATQVMVDEIYEQHWMRLGGDFGTTITAFFSDEPRFGNAKGCDIKIGKPDIVLPWRDGLESELQFDKSLLPLLWISGKNGEEREVRYNYMDIITKLYNENFVSVLANWCEEHGVYYLGHNIEDNGAHARLGYGVGHFFRGQEAQHFSGIDVIGGQVVPGMPYHHDAFQTGGSDGQFYHYALAKLGASAAHLTPHKQGRAMCEAYGAYGWNEGLKTMKWITDHLMVRGINTIVPHAFSPKDYPDADCPPHFYAHGHNPQYRFMPKLTDYANRVMSLLKGGIHKAPIAVLYPAEFEWIGEYMPVEEVTRTLTEHQLDMDIVSIDHIKTAKVSYGQLFIAQESFKVLIVPYAEYLPKIVVEIINELITEGVEVVFVNDYPKNYSAPISSPTVVPLETLASHLAQFGEVSLEDEFKSLVYYHYKNNGKDYWFFFNESVSETIDTKMIFQEQKGQAIAYDAYKDIYFEVINNQLVLEPYQTIMWIFGCKEELTKRTTPHESKELSVIWEVSYASSLAYPEFSPVTQMMKLEPLNSLVDYENVSGTVAYDTVIEIDDPEKVIGLDLSSAFEVAEVFVNEISAGVCISPPYKFETAGLFRKGKNQIRIEVTNTLGTEQRGGFNQYLIIEPFGLTGEIYILYSGA